MQISTFFKFIKIELSLFALPWTLAAAFFALKTTDPPWHMWLWMLMAFFAARTAGMSLNRLIDRHIDAKNPRTADRLLPSGHVKVTEAFAIAALSLILFFVACAMINGICLLLSPLVALLIVAYSSTKRWTAGCHFVLGLIYLLSPLMAWAAFTGDLAWAPVFLGLASMCSVAGTEIIYSLQDLDFDRAEHLHSIPVSFGERTSIAIAATLHLLAVVFLLVFGLSLSLSWFWTLGVSLIALRYLAFYFQLAQKNPLEKICFSCNTSVALILILVTFGEWSWHTLF